MDTILYLSTHKVVDKMTFMYFIFLFMKKELPQKIQPPLLSQKNHPSKSPPPHQY